MGISDLLNLIYSFEHQKKVNLVEKNSNLSFEVLLRKGDNGFFFNLGLPNFKILFKNDTNFILNINEEVRFKIDNFIVKHNSSLTERTCKAYMFRTVGFDKEKIEYFSYYSKIKSYFLLSNMLRENKSSINLKIDNLKFVLSTCYNAEATKSPFLCIQCETKIDYKTFKNYVNSIIVSIGFLTGEFYKKEEFYCHSNHKDFSSNSQLIYRSTELDYSFPRPVEKFPDNWSWKLNDDKQFTSAEIAEYSSVVGERVLSELVVLLLKFPKIYFSIKMLFSFYKDSVISRISLLFIVLETICDEFNKILDTDYIHKVKKYELGLAVLESNKHILKRDDYDVFEDIINNLDNKLVNNVINFEKIFKSLNIRLSKYDTEIFKKRNDFFHGRILPKNVHLSYEEDFYKLEEDYSNKSLRLYVLISKLILKKVGFEGYLINYPKLFSNKDIIRESYFVKL